MIRVLLCEKPKPVTPPPAFEARIEPVMETQGQMVTGRYVQLQFITNGSLSQSIRIEPVYAAALGKALLEAAAAGGV